MTKEKFTQEDRRTLLKLLQVLNRFRELDAEMQMPQAVTLLTVALNEGISLSDLTERTRQATSSTSRNVASLSTVHRKGKPGHGLVLNREDPFERRKKQHILTPKGLSFINQLIEIAG
jgi:DNA-binding MarR family transcriptional regulator